jgi:hypothetical protein
LHAAVFNEPGAMELEGIETGDTGPGEVLEGRDGHRLRRCRAVKGGRMGA